MEKNLINDLTATVHIAKELQMPVIAPENPAAEIYICDECGDSLWDAVLKQDEM